MLGPNVIFWSIPSGDKMGSYMHKGSVEGWDPHWTADSNFIVRKIGPQLLVYTRAEPTKRNIYYLIMIKILL